MTTGRLTLPIETGLDGPIRDLLNRLGADAVRNSDGTELPDLVHELAAKVYSTYFVGRGDQAWADAHPQQLTRIYLMSERTPAPADGALRVPLMSGWFADQIAPDVTCDVARWWQVIDRTTGETVPPLAWRVLGEGPHTEVEVADAACGHVYTVDFLASQIWDPTQMYNYTTNGWADDPTRVKESPYDVRHPETWEHVRGALQTWLAEHPEVDVVRFTTFFYHFTLVFGSDGLERFVDWFGYSASVSVEAMDAFEAEYGYALCAEDFVDEGYYNSSFRPPSRTFRDWIDFQNRFVTGRVTELVEQVHAAGKEAMMFLGDNWIGTEPYGPHFAATGIDAVVGSVGSGATCRMISDIPGVRYTEGRLLPYFFPDVFGGGDPVAEANASWLPARRAIVRSPLDRIGYGGYLSLAIEHPDFIDRTEQIVAEFRAIHDRSAGERPEVAPFRVGVLNSWGRLRSWQTHMVAHALWYRQAYSYLGVVEALAGLPFEVDFLSFDDVVRDGVPDGVGVLINAGAMGTAFSGGPAWADPALAVAVREFVNRGGGLLGVGDPTAHVAGGVTYQLADVFGVDRELGWGLSTNRRMDADPTHFVTADLSGDLDVGEGTPDVVVTADQTQVLDATGGSVRAAASEYGRGRALYVAGLPYNDDNARLLHRSLYWLAGREAEFGDWVADDARVEVAHYPGSGQFLALNNSAEALRVTVRGDGGAWAVDLEPRGHRWVDAAASTPHQSTTQPG